MKNCPKCGKELKLIPAGISRKSGKPYDAFYSCNGCKSTFKEGQVAQIAPSPAISMGATEMVELLKEMKVIMQNMDENIAIIANRASGGKPF